VKTVLDEIDMGGDRLAIFTTVAGESHAVRQIIQDTLKTLSVLGLNPATTHYN